MNERLGREAPIDKTKTTRISRRLSNILGALGMDMESYQSELERFHGLPDQAQSNIEHEALQRAEGSDLVVEFGTDQVHEAWHIARVQVMHDLDRIREDEERRMGGAIL